MSEDTNPLLLLAKRPRRAPSPEGGPTSDITPVIELSVSSAGLGPSVVPDSYGEPTDSGELNSEESETSAPPRRRAFLSSAP